MKTPKTKPLPPIAVSVAICLARALQFYREGRMVEAGMELQVAKEHRNRIPRSGTCHELADLLCWHVEAALLGKDVSDLGWIPVGVKA